MINNKEPKTKNRMLYLIVAIMLCCVYAFPDKKIIFIGSQLIFIAIMLLRRFKHKYPLSKYTLWCGAFIVWSLASSLWAYNTTVALRDLASVIQVMLIGMFLVVFIDNEQKFEFVLKAVIVGGILLCIRLYVVTPTYEWGTERIGYLIGYNANTLGLSLSYAAISAIYLGKKLKFKAYYLCAIIFNTIALFTGSRKAFLLIIIGSALLLTMTIKKRNMKIFVLLSAIIFSWGMYYLIMNIPVLYSVIGRRVESLLNLFSNGEIDASTRTRLYLIEQAWRLFKQQPIIGYGLGNFANLNMFGLYAHNNYLELLCGTGFIGTLIYYSLPFEVFVSSVKGWKNGNRNYALPSTFLICILILDWGMVSYNGELPQILIAISVSYYIYLKKV